MWTDEAGQVNSGNQTELKSLGSGTCFLLSTTGAHIKGLNDKNSGDHKPMKEL